HRHDLATPRALRLDRRRRPVIADDRPRPEQDDKAATRLAQAALPPRCGVHATERIRRWRRKERRRECVRTGRGKGPPRSPSRGRALPDAEERDRTRKSTPGPEGAG